VLRDRSPVTIEAAGLVPGDILLVEEGDRLLRSREEPIFARASPEVKLRIGDALRAERHIVAMTRRRGERRRRAAKGGHRCQGL